jgi:phosphatidylglycerophosphate synthase
MIGAVVAAVVLAGSLWVAELLLARNVALFGFGVIPEGKDEEFVGEVASRSSIRRALLSVGMVSVTVAMFSPTHARAGFALGFSLIALWFVLLSWRILQVILRLRSASLS